MPAGGQSAASLGLLLAENPWLNPQVLALTGAMVAALLVGAAIIAWADRYRKRLAHDRFTANEEMTSYRELYERGELTREEYDRLRGVLRGRLQQELQRPDGKDRPPGAGPTLAPPRQEPPPEQAPPGRTD